MTIKDRDIGIIVDRWTVPVYPPSTGRILEWYGKDYLYVRKGEPLYQFKYYVMQIKEDVPSPVTGILRIFVRADPDTDISTVTRIAEIKMDIPI
ncbi:MAG: hypothetical protein A3E19_02495 [Planctomycetes bacterium RIFCSPHIGHO2_12_FULL_52_36]|nr:MAG: hypothetical protein A3D89_04335 [Planctomycetes bacterium RIFCSPHIGHO2_02_FULL_52_58]OHB93299.1 MAG: hypothetical protein A3E19_02495 [Planctomycetes bacterium RIFCSPHIGHO2_12_FULL_52_36]